MMKRTALLLLFAMSLSLALPAQSEFPVVADISLIKGDTESGIFPPARLVLAVDMWREAYYKLSDKENVLKGGLFRPGLNVISIETDNLFIKSGSHIYYLDLKVKDLIFREAVEIDIQLDTQEIEKKEDNQTEKREYKLSLLVGDELIISSTKIPQKNLPLKFEFPPWPDTFKPNNPIERTNSPLNTVSIFDALGAAYGLIKNLLEKKKEEKETAPIQKQKQMTVTFLRRDSEGFAQEVKAEITLKTKESKIPF